MLLVIAFIATTVFPSNLSYASSSDEPFTLHPGYMARPIAHDEIGDKGMVSFTLLEEVKKDPGILADPASVPGDARTDLGPRTVDILFSQKKRLDVVQRLSDDKIRDIFSIPCVVTSEPSATITEGSGTTSYFSLLLVYQDGSMKAAVYDSAEWPSLVSTLQQNITPETVAELLAQGRMQELSALETVKYIASSDESARIAVSFLEAIGAVSAARELREVLDMKKLLVVETPAFAPDGIVVSGQGNDKERAAAILGKLLLNSGIRSEDLKDALDVFCGMWLRGEVGAFNVGQVAPRLGNLVSELENSAGNEGYIRFHENAFTRMISVAKIELGDCKAEIADIKEIFRQVAEHDLPESLRAKYELLHLAKLQDEAAKRQDFTEAARLRDRKADLAKTLGIEDKAALDAALKELEATFSEIPGLNPDKIVVEETKTADRVKTTGLLPTDRVTRDGTITLNGNFVKIMHRLNKIWGKVPKEEISEALDKFKTGTPDEKEQARVKLVRAGGMFEISDDPHRYNDPPTEFLGFLYPSILHSLAIHTVRGHFNVNDNGTVIFNPNEETAQPERGRKYLYTNLLAMMYYWILIVESDTNMQKRSDSFVLEYPEIFKGLTPAQRSKFTDNLVKIGAFQYQLGSWKNDGPWPYKQYLDMVESDPEKVMFAGPDVVSNEGLGHYGQASTTASQVMAAIFQMLSFSNGRLSGAEILSAFTGMTPNIVQSSIESLVDLGLVVEHEEPGTGSVQYSLVLVPEPTKAKINRILMEETESAKVKGEIYALTEPGWAYALHDALVKSNEALAMKEQGRIQRIALEASWIPEGQEDDVKTVIQEMLKLNGEEGVEIIMRTAADKRNGVKLADIVKKNVPSGEYGDLLIMDSREEMEAGNYAAFQGLAFLVGVDPTELNKAAPAGEANYTRLLEMMVMAIRKSRNLPPIGDHAKVQCIEMRDKNGNVIERAYIFIPSADPIDFEMMHEVFGAQAQALHSV